MRLEHPGLFTEVISDNKNSDHFSPGLYLSTDSKDAAIMCMTELAVGLELYEKIYNKAGVAAPLISISKTIERAFNCDFKDIYEKKSQLFRRKPFNLTKGLDQLRTLIMREYKRREQEIKKK